MSMIISSNSVSVQHINSEVAAIKPPKNLPLEGEALEKFDELNSIMLTCNEALSKDKIPFRVDTFRDQLINRFLNLKIIPIEHYFYGTGASPRKAYNDIDIGIKVRNDADLEQAPRAIVYTLKQLGHEQYLIEETRYSDDKKSVTITISTHPKKLDIVVIKEEPEDAIEDKPKILCDSSVTCRHIVSCDGVNFVRVLGEYDIKEAEDLLEISKFTIKPLAHALIMANGLFRYCKLLMKGLLGDNEEIESTFCQGFANKYIHPNFEEGRHLIERILTFTKKFSQPEALAFLLTLENVLSRSELRDKETYCSILRSFIPNWDEEKTAIFLDACGNDYKKIEDKTKPHLPPRYLLHTKDTSLAIEPSPSCIKDLLSKNTLEDTRLALDFIENMNDYPAEILSTVLRSAVKYDMQLIATTLFYNNIGKLFQLDKNKLLSLTRVFPKSRYAHLVQLLLTQDLLRYIDALDDYFQGKGLETKKEQEKLLKLAKVPLQFNHENIIEDLLDSSNMEWFSIGLKKTSSERIIRYILESDLLENRKDLIIEKILACHHVNPMDLIKCLDKLGWDAQLNPLIKTEISAAITTGNFGFACQLLEKGNLLLSEKLTFALQIEPKNRSHFWLEITRIEHLLAKGSLKTVNLALGFIKGMQNCPAETIEKGIRAAIKYKMLGIAHDLFHDNIAQLFTLDRAQLFSLVQIFSKNKYVSLVKHLLNRDLSAYIYALKDYFQNKGSEARKEQEYLLKLADVPLQLNNDDIVEDLLRSSSKEWFVIGLNKTSSKRIMEYLIENDVPENYKDVIIEKLLTYDGSNPIVLIKCLNKFGWDAQLNPLIKSHIIASLEIGNFDFVYQLLEKGKLLPSEKLFFALQIKTEHSGHLCFSLAQNSNLSDQEKVFFHLIETGLFEKALNLVDKISIPKLINALTKIREKSLSKGSVYLSDLILSTILSENAAPSMSIMITGIEQLVRASMYSRVFFYLKVHFKNRPHKDKIEILRVLENIPAIAFFLKSFEGGKFQHETYLNNLEDVPEIFKEKEFQEALLELINEPLSLNNLEKIHLSSTPIWRKLGMARLSDEQFLEYMITDLKEDQINNTIRNRFKEICSKSAEKCARAYLKFSSKEFLKESDKIMKALSLESPFKQKILAALFEQHAAKDKKSKEELTDLIKTTKKYCKADISLCTTVSDELLKKIELKESFTKNLFYSTCQLLHALKKEDRLRLMAPLIQKAVQSNFLEDAQVYLEEQFESFLDLPNKQLALALKGLKVSKDQASLIFDKALKEENLQTKAELLTYSFEFLLNEPSFETASSCFDILNNTLFSPEQLIQNAHFFLKIQLDRSSKQLSADLVFSHMLSVIKEHPKSNLDAHLRVFILNNWKYFQTASLCDANAIDDLSFSQEIAAKLKAANNAYTKAVKEKKQKSEPVNLGPLMTSLFSGFNLVPLEQAAACEEAENDIYRFYHFLTLLDNPLCFGPPYMFIIQSKIAIAEQLGSPHLWEQDMARTFHTDWKNYRNETAIKFITHITLQSLHVRLTDPTEFNITKAQEILIEGTQGAALEESFILEAQKKISQHLPAWKKTDFESKMVAALKKGGYRPSASLTLAKNFAAFLDSSPNNEKSTLNNLTSYLKETNFSLKNLQELNDETKINSTPNRPSKKRKIANNT
ncbi:MAG: hypothetical protein V4494_01995 [Chlamydiota bacterium]